jgi:F-type H+-transporting ATPase subunit delta
MLILLVILLRNLFCFVSVLTFFFFFFFPLQKPSGAAGSPGAQLAKALYTATELAKAGQKDATNLHEVVAKDLKAVAGALAMPEWLTFFKSPIIAREARLDTLNEFFTKLGASEITRRFFSQLVDSKLTKHVPAMVTAYQEIVRSHRSEVEATVVTAKPLTPYERQTLIDDIADEYLEIGKKLILTEEVDESLLGGYTLMLGTRYFDYRFYPTISDVFVGFLLNTLCVDSVKSRMDEIIEQYRALVQGAHEKEMQRFNKI